MVKAIKKKYQAIIFGVVFIVFAIYLGGLLESIFYHPETTTLNFLPNIKYGITSVSGLILSLAAAVNFAIFGAVVVFTSKKSGVKETDKERKFDYADEGTYGTASWMTKIEYHKALQHEKKIERVDGYIFGTSLEDPDEIVALGNDSPLNRNFAICGSQGSMKSRAIARNWIISCALRGESILCTDPKSELYEDTRYYLEHEMGYTVKQYNLLNHDNSDAWDCLAEIDDGELIDVFVDVVIRNTTDEFDHFYDNAEMDLLKALCLYVFHEYPPEKRTFPEAYNLLLNSSVEKLDAIFANLPVTHPARGPWQLFSKAEKVKGNAILGLGTRLQILQNKKIQRITGTKDIDLELPGKEKCAYFCIVSDQDSTYDVLATLFVSFLFIKLIRFADRQDARVLPVPMMMILDEFCNIGIVSDFKKKLGVARSRRCGIAIFYQNLPMLQNRYPDGEWEELLGGCDTSIFLGCNDLTTAKYFSERIGETSVHVSTMRKNLKTIRMTDYVPEYAENSSVGRRMVMLPDELLRYPLDQSIVILRGNNAVKLKKMDYTKHPESKKFRQVKVKEHIPEWRKQDSSFFEYEGYGEKEAEQSYDHWQQDDLESVSFNEYREGGSKREERPEKKKGKKVKVTKIEDLFS